MISTALSTATGESVKKALKELERRGHPVVLASGRGLESKEFMERRLTSLSAV